MLAATPSPRLAYLWEPFSVIHRPGICDARFPYWYPYVCADNGDRYEPSIRDMLSFRYKTLAELRALRSPKDAARMARDRLAFERYRRSRAVPLLKDPIAVLSAGWLGDAFGMDVVVLTRHPAAFAHSLTRRNLTHPFEHFLRQPLLMRDLLGPYREEIEDHAARPRPILDQAILLWNLIHSVIQRYRDTRSSWSFLRLEDVARDPVSQFESLFDRLELGFDDRVRSTILAHSAPSNRPEVEDASSVRRDSEASIGTWRTGLSPREIERVRLGVEPVSGAFYGDDEW